MTLFLVYLLIYGPPLLLGIVYHFRQKKRFPGNPMKMYLMPAIVMTVSSVLWTVFLYMFAARFMQ